jgi:heme/copper-type cytochrome/quinol oxidase subunit 2
VGRTVQLTLRSRDVIHSFWVPALRYKRDVFPSYTNTLTLRIDRAGEWIGRCAEYCGQLHYQMDFRLRALPARQFDAWLHSPAAAAGTVPA